MKNGYKILAVETSCDETAAAVVKDGRFVMSNIVKSQIDIHRQYGGVVPEVASRNHVNDIDLIVKEALNAAGLTLQQIDAIAVTYGAGLVGALLVGVSYAKGLSYGLGKPLIAVNHIQGHISANYIAFPKLQPPFLCLVASGGHTSVVRVDGYTEFEVLGSTLDDAAGEAFDKVARILGLPYPGGPHLERLAKSGSANINFFKNPVRPLGGYDFSYSGLKTAVVNYVHNNFGAKCGMTDENRADIAASFQSMAVDILLRNIERAIKETGLKTVSIAGGVAANAYFKERLLKLCANTEAAALLLPTNLCGDNAAMIGASAYFNIAGGKPFADLSLNAMPSLKIDGRLKR